MLNAIETVVSDLNYAGLLDVDAEAPEKWMKWIGEALTNSVDASADAETVAKAVTSHLVDAGAIVGNVTENAPLVWEVAMATLTGLPVDDEKIKAAIVGLPEAPAKPAPAKVESKGKPKSKGKGATKPKPAPTGDPVADTLNEVVGTDKAGKPVMFVEAQGYGAVRFMAESMKVLRPEIFAEYGKIKHEGGATDESRRKAYAFIVAKFVEEFYRHF